MHRWGSWMSGQTLMCPGILSFSNGFDIQIIHDIQRYENRYWHNLLFREAEMPIPFIVPVKIICGFCLHERGEKIRFNNRDVFLRVQAEIDRRANIIKGGKKRVYSSKYALSSVIICGHCGDIFRRIKCNNHGCKSTVWRYVSRVNKKKSGIDCPVRTVHEEVIQEEVVIVVNDVWSRKDEILPQLKENIRAVLQEDTDAKIAEIDAAVKEKQEELLNVGEDENKIAEIGEAIMKLREGRQQVMTNAAMRKDVKDRIPYLSNFLDEQTVAITEYSVALVRGLIEKITVYDEDLLIKFKSGLEITVNK